MPILCYVLGRMGARLGRFFKIVGIALLSVVLLVTIGIGGLVAYGALQPKSFDECMLVEMRGQDQAVIENVRAVCQRRFHVMLEVDVPAGQWSWSHEQGLLTIMMVSPFSQTYDLARVEATVSPKDCAASSAADWSESLTLFAFTTYSAGLAFDEPAVCMRIQQVFAYRR